MTLTEKLDKRWLESLTNPEWAEIIKSIIREDKQHECAVNRRPLPLAFASLPSLGVCVRLPLDQRAVNEFGEIVAASVFLRSLDTQTKTGMRNGFVSMLYEFEKTTAEGWEEVFEAAFLFAVPVGGILRKPFLQRMLNKQGVSQKTQGLIKGFLHR